MQKSYLQERRKYIRLNSVFPVEIYLASDRVSKPRLVQAFTHDVSLGGLCLSVNDPDDELISTVHDGTSSFDITINMPITHHPIEARVRAAWHDVREGHRHKRLMIGVSYDRISDGDKNRIFKAARRMKWLPRITLFSIVLLAGLLAIISYNNARLKEDNKALIEQFYRIQDMAEAYKNSLAKVGVKYETAKVELEKNGLLIDNLNKELSRASKTGDLELLKAQKQKLDESLKIALGDKTLLEEKVRALNESKAKAGRLLDEANQRRKVLQEATVKNMYQWLKTHQNKFTGLVMSFEGDSSVRDWAFTYDQALASQVFLISNDIERAAYVLEFFRKSARKKSGGYLNAYNVMTGYPAEEVAHIGPNIWMGIAAIQYSHKTGDDKYLGLAEDVARWAISLKDKEGGVKGGPGISWYSTEHNLDAYALFNMLYVLTSKEIYKEEKDSTFKWLKENTYSKNSGGMKRGKGDATIATDTLAWAIAAIGPAALLKEGMDPDGIMKFAEEHCLVTTSFRRPDNSVTRLSGFDFAKEKNMARSGVVSSEWTAQMVISFGIMADFYAKLNDSQKAQEYGWKRDRYLNELDKMVISSPSPSGQGAGCLPYASQPGADTGHGWRTPSGTDTGSVSGTAYTIFAKRGFNPLSLD